MVCGSGGSDRSYMQSFLLSICHIEKVGFLIMKSGKRISEIRKIVDNKS